MFNNLPSSALVNKFVPKSKFYEKANLGAKMQAEFVQKIQKITWSYKLAQETIGIAKTDKVTEIEIFDIELKKQLIPIDVLKVIDKSIPYQILYVFTFKGYTAYGITLKENNSVGNYYFSGWNAPLQFDFTGINLGIVYQNLIKAFMPQTLQAVGDFSAAVQLDYRIKQLVKEISLLENKLSRQKQFNRKVELNNVLIGKKKELESLKVLPEF